MKKGLVLSGGGARGAYQVGAWKALRKLHYKFDIVTGCSVGAINGVFVVQKQLHKCEKLWKTISFSRIYGNDFYQDEEIKMTKIYKKYLKTFIKEKGADTANLDILFGSNIRPKKFFKSKIDFGITTYNVTTHQPIFLKKSDLNNHNLVDYVLASATCFPAFKVRQIGQEKFIDGGYHDYMPINLAIEMGAEEIIAIDLNAIGIRQKTKNKNVKVTKIEPRNKIVNFLVFDSTKSCEAIKFGYNDTMKTFGKLDGNKYTFKKGQLLKNYYKYQEKYNKKIKNILNEKSSIIVNALKQLGGLNKIIYKDITITDFNKNIESLGRIFEINECNIYKIRKFNKLLLNSLKDVETITFKTIEEKIRNKELKEVINKKKIIKYIYNQLDNIETQEQRQAMNKIACIFKNEFLEAIYLKTIEKPKFSIFKVRNV